MAMKTYQMSAEIR